MALDSALFEFRSYLELLATFIYKFLVGIGKPPPSKVRHSSGEELEVVNNRGKLNTHNFLRHLCDELSCAEGWYAFLSKHRNFFTHNGAPYIAIEGGLVRPPEFEFLIMLTNIHNFEDAHRGDYFRLSELQDVVEGVKSLARAAQKNSPSSREANLSGVRECKRLGRGPMTASGGISHAGWTSVKVGPHARTDRFDIASRATSCATSSIPRTLAAPIFPASPSAC